MNDRYFLNIGGKAIASYDNLRDAAIFAVNNEDGEIFTIYDFTKRRYLTGAEILLASICSCPTWKEDGF